MEEQEERSSTTLGGNITLVGFKAVDRADLVVVKKIVGSYTRKLSDTIPEFESITVTLKLVHHKEEGNPKYELHAKAVVRGKLIASEVTERNLFVGLDDVLKKVLEMAFKEKQV